MYSEIFAEQQNELKGENTNFEIKVSELKTAQPFKGNKPPPPKYAFAECRNHHLVGIVVDQRFYFTDVSPIRMMFPQAHYEDWSS